MVDLGGQDFRTTSHTRSWTVWGVHRLYQEVRRPPLDAGTHILFIGVCGDEYHRQLRRVPVQLKLVKNCKASSPSAQTDIQQHSTDAVPVVFEVCKPPVGIQHTLHLEMVLEDLIQNGQIQLGIVDHQQCVPYHARAPSPKYPSISAATCSLSRLASQVSAVSLFLC